MKNLALALSLAALCLISLASANAQDTTTYNPIMEKRADLRMKYVKAQRDAAKAAKEAKARETTARKHETRVNHAYMTDFMARSAKRADLRARISKVGMEKAYEEWQEREYRH